MMTTRSASSVAEELYELIEDNGFTNTSTRANGYESEWTLYYDNGSFSTVEVFVSGKAIEVYRAEYNKDEVQIRAKDSTVLNGGLTTEAVRLIRPLS